MLIYSLLELHEPCGILSLSLSISHCVSKKNKPVTTSYTNLLTKKVRTSASTPFSQATISQVVFLSYDIFTWSLIVSNDSLYMKLVASQTMFHLEERGNIELFFLEICL
jgi:hypothetical protein